MSPRHPGSTVLLTPLLALICILMAPLSLGAEEPPAPSTTAGSITESAAEPDSLFTIWLTELRLEASNKGISPATLEIALAGAELLPRVIELDRNQPEFTLTFEEYLRRVVPDSRIQTGKRLLLENRDLLGQVSSRFGVPPRVIVALWGVETDFGRIQGGYSIIDALSTLAFDGRRSDYFRGELLNALKILDEGHIDAAGFKGSWAGAMGQCQFMPSSFIHHAIDFNNDGRRDIWGTRADVFASAANYLAKSGWNGANIWGRPVKLPDDFAEALTGLKIQKPISAWQTLGVRKISGADLPRSPDLISSVIAPDGLPGPAYLVYDNYEAILKWNRSIYFATAVGILSDRIGGR